MATKTRKSAGSSSYLLEIAALRNSPEYRAAEQTRRAKGAETLARAEDSSADYAAVRLLIGTWETIATRFAAGDIPKVEFFKALPIWYMWLALKGAVMEIRKKPGMKQYATSFEDLAKAYKAWLDKQPADYQSGAESGVHAHFG